MGSIWYEPESDSPGTYTQWHTWTAEDEDEWLGPPGREYYNTLHEQGGNLIWCDGHAEYRKNVNTSSLDWGLVDANGNNVPYEPTDANSRATYYPAQ
jgi:prepilin-type processing-associated H-X9-DG protein